MSTSTAIPMVDLREQYLSLQDGIDSAIAEVLQNTQFIMGGNVRALEAEVADYLGVEHAVACANGTDALHLALRALNIGPGDEVITTPFTFIATAEAIAYVGASPVFVDIDQHTYNLSVDAVEHAITSRTRAILPVHLFGLPCDMAALKSLASQHQLALVEDCAQSFGARVGKEKTGAIGDLGCHSFFPSKNLGCFGDGGMITTSNDTLAEKLRVLRAHGSTKQYHHTVIGYNSRLDEMQAAILRQKLPNIDEYNAQRWRVASRYCDNLSQLDIQLPLLHTPYTADQSAGVFHQFTILVENTEQRAHIQDTLKQANIASAIYYPIPLHKQTAMEERIEATTCPVAETVAERCLSLPVYPEMTDEKIDRVCDAVKQALN